MASVVISDAGGVGAKHDTTDELDLPATALKELGWSLRRRPSPSGGSRESAGLAQQQTPSESLLYLRR